MDEALFAALTADVGVSAIVGSAIYWNEYPQGIAAPAIVLNIISGADQPTLRGTDSVWTYRVQIDCYGTSRPQARTLSRAVLDLLNGYRAGGILGAFIISQRDMSAEVDAPVHRYSMDFSIVYRG